MKFLISFLWPKIVISDFLCENIPIISSWKIYQNPKGISLMVSWVGNCALQEEMARIMRTNLTVACLPISASVDQSINIREWVSPNVTKRLTNCNKFWKQFLVRCYKFDLLKYYLEISLPSIFSDLEMTTIFFPTYQGNEKNPHLRGHTQTT